MSVAPQARISAFFAGLFRRARQRAGTRARAAANAIDWPWLPSSPRSRRAPDPRMTDAPTRFRPPRTLKAPVGLWFSCLTWTSAPSARPAADGAGGATAPSRHTRGRAPRGCRRWLGDCTGFTVHRLACAMRVCDPLVTTRTARSGRSVMMPSTPRSKSRRMSASSLTVHTYNARVALVHGAEEPRRDHLQAARLFWHLERAIAHAARGSSRATNDTAPSALPWARRSVTIRGSRARTATGPAG